MSAEKNEDGSIVIKMIDGPEIHVSDPWDTVVEVLFPEDGREVSS